TCLRGRNSIRKEKKRKSKNKFGAGRVSGVEREGKRPMSGGGDVLYGPKLDLLGRLSSRFRFGSSPHEPRSPSVIDLQTRLPGFLLVWDWAGIVALGLLIDIGIAQPEQGFRLHGLDVVLGATLTVNYLHLLRGYCIRGMRRMPAQLAKVTLAWI